MHAKTMSNRGMLGGKDYREGCAECRVDVETCY